MITKYELFENTEGWTIDKIKQQLGIKDVMNPMDIPFTDKSKNLHDDIIKYLLWKYNMDMCHIYYYFTNDDAQLGIKFMNEESKPYLLIMNKDKPELVKYLNDPDFFLETGKYNL